MTSEKKLKILAVIPARYDSSRLPGKPLALIGDKPMVQWVYERTAGFPGFDKVLVATDDQRIFDAVKGFGGEVEMTSPDHLTGTDRAAEVAARHLGFDVVVNVQGDSPFLDNIVFQKILEPYFLGENPDVVNLASPLIKGDSENPDVVKLVCDPIGVVSSFSRSSNFGDGKKIFTHVGLYAFRPDFLQKFVLLRPGDLEKKERVEMFRVLEHGYSLRIAYLDKMVLSVDTAKDLNQANLFIKQFDGLVSKRIICCISPHGLLAALAAVKFLEPEDKKFINYLVIHSLSDGLDLKEQGQDIFLTIKQMAQATLSWEKVIFLNNRDFYESFKKETRVDLIRLVSERVGVKDPDEIYLPRNWDFFNNLLMRAYPLAKKICYGDGLSIYHDYDVATNKYYYKNIFRLGNFLRPWYFIKLILRWVDIAVSDKFWLRDLFGLYPVLLNSNFVPYQRESFDAGCYLFPNGMGVGSGEVLSKYYLPRETFLKVIEEVVASLESQPLSELERIVKEDKVMVVLLVSFPFYKISFKNQIAAYVEFFNKQVNDDEFFVVFKYHPKINAEILKELKSFIARRYRRFIIMEGKNFAYLPLEIILKWLAVKKNVQVESVSKVVTFATSALGTTKIFKIKTVVGFGPRLILKYFKTLDIPSRLWEEYLIKRESKKASR